MGDKYEPLAIQLFFVWWSTLDALKMEMQQREVPDHVIVEGQSPVPPQRWSPNRALHEWEQLDGEQQAAWCTYAAKVRMFARVPA